MNSIINRIDKLDMVYVLRLSALIVFVAGLFSILMTFLPYIRPNNFDIRPRDFDLSFLWSIFSMILVNLYRYLFEVAVLLGLAELIKVVKKKND